MQYKCKVPWLALKNFYTFWIIDLNILIFVKILFTHYSNANFRKVLQFMKILQQLKKALMTSCKTRVKYYLDIFNRFHNASGFLLYVIFLWFFSLLILIALI